MSHIPVRESGPPPAIAGWPDLILRRIALKVASLLPDDAAAAHAVLSYAGEIVDGFLADASPDQVERPE